MARGTVLIADDDAAIRQSVGFMLAKAGNRTKSHASGAEFMKFVNSETTCRIHDNNITTLFFRFNNGV